MCGASNCDAPHFFDVIEDMEYLFLLLGLFPDLFGILSFIKMKAV